MSRFGLRAGTGGPHAAPAVAAAGMFLQAEAATTPPESREGRAVCAVPTPLSIAFERRPRRRGWGAGRTRMRKACARGRDARYVDLHGRVSSSRLECAVHVASEKGRVCGLN